MKSTEQMKLEPNQHALSSQINDLLIKFGFNQENIISQITEVEFQDNDINAPLSLQAEIQKLANSNKLDEKVVVFKLGASDRSFKENQGENNHYVALYFHEEKIHYIDPTGKSVSKTVEQFIKSSHGSLSAVEILSSNNVLQYTNEQNIGRPDYIMGGNDTDCGILLPLAIDLISNNYQERILLPEVNSKRLGGILRDVVNGEQELDKREIGSVLEPNVTLLKEAILWNFDLSNNFTSYNRSPVKGEINDKYNEGNDFSGRTWGAFYKNKSEDTISELLSFSIDELKLGYDDVVSSIKEEIGQYQEQLDYGKKSKNIIDSLARVNASRPENSSSNLRISSLLKNIGHEVSPQNIADVGSGKSGCKSVTINGDKHFIKPFSYTRQNREIGINPREPFLYKVLEYMNLGPKTTFLIGGGSSFGVSAGIKEGNYIMTKGEELFFDGQIADHKTGREAKALNVEFYNNFKNSKKENAVDISCASLIKVLLSMGDVYPDNTENYGISTEGNFKFIDHLPGNNGEFSGIHDEMARNQQYSPRTSMQNLCNDSSYKGNLSDLSESHNRWQKFTLSQEVNERVFGGNKLQKAITSALNDTLQVMRQKDNYFVEDAEVDLQGYIDKINTNIQKYKETEYAKRSGMEL